ncbi:hypothetical protein FQN54_006204 [Arachnomyces sp. PD_36]|nr:hypothetical protein FQN54_006204 [Arachnomyces sp. PD_36]
MAFRNISVKAWRRRFREFRNAKRVSKQETNEDLQPQTKESDQEQPKDDDLRLPPGVVIPGPLFIPSRWPHDNSYDRHPGQAVTYYVFPGDMNDNVRNKQTYDQISAIVGTKRVSESNSTLRLPNKPKEVYSWLVMLAEEEVPKVRGISGVGNPSEG